MNKYHRWYNQIIEHRRTNLAEGYTEKHHIVPKSLGGTNDTTNLVSLTAREHFVCHWLLTKMVVGDDRIKMLRALNAFSISSKKNPRKLTSRQYAIARAAYVPFKGRKRSAEQIAKQAAKLRGRKQTIESNTRRSNTLKGRSFTQEHLDNLSKALKGRTSPTKGMKFEYRPQPTTQCPHCDRTISKNNLAKHIRGMHS
jgi:5-methylcytosine-specific restriction endonuclease McrA